MLSNSLPRFNGMQVFYSLFRTKAGLNQTSN